MSVAASLISPPGVSSDTLESLLLGLAQPPEGVPGALWESTLVGPVSEFLRRPGKQFRSRLVEFAWSLAGRSDAELPPRLPLVVELLHAGSLVVDDIEDGSVQRRGRAALHRLVGMPIALNAGNWLYFWATSLLETMGLPASVELALYRHTSAAIRTCHEGQALDLGTRIGDLHPSEIGPVVRVISERKTGSLMALAAGLGGVAAGASESRLKALTDFGERVGVGLQMQNDLSELTGAAGPIKQPEDLIHGRVTWPWAWAAERLPAWSFDALQVRGASLSEGSGDSAAVARDLRAALGPDPAIPVRRWLEEAFEELQRHVGAHPALPKMKAELVRLETRYV